MADIRQDVRFTAGDLADPVLSIEYGIDYLGLLLDRFDGAYPLAIASYNGGPFNVSAWLTGTGAEMPMDAWVEHIPFRETRQYVKKVSAGYASYVGLYGPKEAIIALPASPRGDHPDVVDF
jgi:soluble lytic murein transglycosylase